MKQVVVVGGDPAYVRDTLGKKLISVGVNPERHYGWGYKGPVNLPDGCDGLLLLAKEASSGLSRQARDAVRKADLPLAECSERKFAHMLQALKTVGLVDGEGPTNVEKAEAPAPEPKEDKEHPSLQETAEWATLYIEDKPERTNQDIVAQIKKEKATNGFSEDDLLAVVKGVRTQLLQQWASGHRKSKDLGIKVRKIKVAWGVRFYLKTVQETGHPPRHKDIRAAAEPLFGSGLSTEIRTIILQRGKAEADSKGTLVRPAPRKAPTKKQGEKMTEVEYRKEIQKLNGTINLLKGTLDRTKEAHQKEKAEHDGIVTALKAQRKTLSDEVEDLREKAQAATKENGKSSSSAAAVEKHYSGIVKKLTDRNKALTTNLEATRKDLASVERANEMLKAENLTLAKDLEEALQGVEKSGTTLDDLVKMGWEIHVKPPQS